MKNKLSPYTIIILSFLSVILIGSILLILPISLNEGVKVSYVDSLFISTSNVTITGLSPINIKDTYSLFGKIVLVVLMQIGGLSVTTIAYFIITLLGAKIGFGSRKVVLESINMDSMRGVIKVVKNIVKLALVIELIGIILFTILFLNKGETFINSLGYSVFHTVSSYTNAGIDIFGNSSLITHNKDIIFNILTMILIIIGGLGSVVIFDLIEKKSFRKLNFHSKIVLKMTTILLIVGFISFYLLESNSSILEAMFHSVTLRTSGFYTYDYGQVKQTTVLIMLLLMFIGGAPASNAGGIKITTLYTLYKSSTSYIKDTEAVAYKRSIPSRYQHKAFMILFISLNVIVVATVSISYFEPGINLTTIFFEVVSAFSSTGITLNLTSSLSSTSKIILIIIMFIGRVGVITFAHSIIKNKKKKPTMLGYVDLQYII